MAKKGTKIKRYGSIYERRNGSVIIAVLMAAGLVIFGIAGWLLYTPVHDFIMQLGSDETSHPNTVSSEPAPSENTVTSSQPDIPQQNDAINIQKDIKGVYLPAEQVMNENAFAVALEKAKAAEINTVFVDAKDASGTVLYSSSNEVAKSSGVAAVSVYNAVKTADSIKEKGMTPAVRIHAFKDAVAPEIDRDMAVHYYDTETYWLDNSPELGGKKWLNPYSDKTQEYILSLIDELCDAGFEIILLDSVQFPSGVALDKAGYGETAKTVTKSQLLSDFVKKAKETAEDNGAQLMLCTDSELFAPVAEKNNDYLYGGNPTAFFTEKILLTLPQDNSAWNSRIAMIKENTESEIISVIRSYADDGTPLVSGDLVVKLSETGSDGYMLYDPQGNYKFD